MSSRSWLGSWITSRPNRAARRRPLRRRALRDLEQLERRDVPSGTTHVYSLPPPSPVQASFTNGGPVAEGETGVVSFVNVSGGARRYTFSYDFDNDGVFEIANSTQPSAVVPTRYLADGPATSIAVHGRITDRNDDF